MKRKSVATEKSKNSAYILFKVSAKSQRYPYISLEIWGLDDTAAGVCGFSEPIFMPVMSGSLNPADCCGEMCKGSII
jgi:hypothetical protein